MAEAPWAKAGVAAGEAMGEVCMGPLAVCLVYGTRRRWRPMVLPAAWAGCRNGHYVWCAAFCKNTSGSVAAEGAEMMAVAQKKFRQPLAAWERGGKVRG